MREIELTQGLVALVDDHDYEKLSDYNWCAARDHNTNRFYAVSSTQGKQQKMHRVIMEAKPHQKIDHIDGSGLNNQKANLRIATTAQNAWNSKGQGGTSKYKGVYWNKKTKRWYARIQCNRKRVWLGYYKTELEAGKAYKTAAESLHGKFYCKKGLTV